MGLTARAARCSKRLYRVQHAILGFIRRKIIPGSLETTDLCKVPSAAEFEGSVAQVLGAQEALREDANRIAPEPEALGSLSENGG
jgi:hypothetical protein